MVAGYEDEFICDLAEYYHVYDWRGLPLKTAAVLANGLPLSSRTKMAMNGERITLDQALLAIIADRLSVLVWQNTEDGINGRRPPKSILNALTKKKAAHGNEMTFKSSEDFEVAKRKILEGFNGDNNWESLCSDPSID